jgi:hypothetical protein
MAKDLEEILKEAGELPSEPTFDPEIPLLEAMLRTEQLIGNLERIEQECIAFLGEDAVAFLAKQRLQ